MSFHHQQQQQNGFLGFSSNGYERSTYWINNQRFHPHDEQVAAAAATAVAEVPHHVYHAGEGGGMLTELVHDFSRGGSVINNKTVDDDVVLNHHHQIQSTSYRWPPHQDDQLALMHNHETVTILPSSSSSQFDWLRNNNNNNNDIVDSATAKIGRINIIEQGQAGLSLSLSTNLDYSAAKFQELRTAGGGGGGGMCYFDPGIRSRNVLENSSTISIATNSRMRNSLYLKAAQELLEEFCCVGRGHFKNASKFGVGSPNNGGGGGGGSGGGGTAVSGSSKERQQPLSASERADYQRRKAKLLSMLDEVDGRYTNYCDQMQTIVNSFDLVMGKEGSASPYTILAHKAMSRHFRNIKDAIVSQVKVTCELLGDKDLTGTVGLTKGETPRLKFLDKKFRQHKFLHQLGILDPEAWRPQRGLPERSVNTLRAWLFEHFLHPYPSEADKHSLARQTGLSKNQVSNWFINARVRLWKPMVEEIYKQEEMEEEDLEETTTEDPSSNEAKISSEDHKNNNIITYDHHHHHHPHTSSSSSSPSSSSTTKTTVVALLQAAASGGRRSEINAAIEKDPSKNTMINYGRQIYSSGNETAAPAVLIRGNSSSNNNNVINYNSIITTTTNTAAATVVHHHNHGDEPMAVYDSYNTAINPSVDHGTNIAHMQIRRNQNQYDSFIGMTRGAAVVGGDHVSLTLGLQHSENQVLPRKRDDFSIGNFGNY